MDEHEHQGSNDRRVLWISLAVLGGVIGAVLAANGLANTSDNVTDPFGVLFLGPIPAAITLPLVFVWGVIMPVIAWFWHTRAIDEQEASAYRDGGYDAAYAFSDSRTHMVALVARRLFA